jgi:LysM repeat protein
MRKHLLVAVVTLGTTAVVSLPAQAATHASVKLAAATKTENSVKNTPAPKHYAVVAGDNLSKIASDQGLDSWRPLWNANISISNPDLIFPGQDLVIPNGPTTDRALPQDVSASSLDAAYNSAAAANPRPVVHYATRPAAAPVYSSSGSIPSILSRVKMHESGGNYATNTGNGYYGAYQFDLGTWRSNAPAGWANTRPDLAPPSVQDQAAATLYARRGCSPWPNTCY